jgi:hypothetical protein
VRWYLRYKFSLRDLVEMMVERELDIEMVLEPQLRDANGTSVADYLRLRFAATKARD